MKKKSIAVVRQRGQITIPDAIRRAAGWVEIDAAVTVYLAEDGSIQIKPYTKGEKPNNDTMWAAIHKARSIKGKGGNLAAFIVKDRQQRR